MEPDLTRIAGRSQALRRQERVRRAALVAAALLLVPLAYRGYGVGTEELRPAPATHPHPTSTSTSAPASDTNPDAPGPGSTGVGTAPAASGRPSGAASPARPEIAEGTAAPTAAPGSADFPARPSCHVSTGGVPEGQTSSCRFTATAVGGWRVQSSEYTVSKGDLGEVLVQRAGKTTRYVVPSFGNPPPCRDDVIRPGDLVTVTVNGQVDPVAFQNNQDLAAGADYGC